MVRWYCDRCDKVITENGNKLHDNFQVLVEEQDEDEHDYLVVKKSYLLCEDCLTEFKKWVNKVT